MKKYLKKKLAYLICAALLIGWMPVNQAGAADTDESSDTQKILIVGEVKDDGNSGRDILLKVDTSKLAGLNIKDYRWTTGSDGAEPIKDSNTSDTYTLTTSIPSAVFKNGYIRVEAMDDTGEIVADSEKRVFNNYSLEVDSLEGVSIQNVSVSGKADGRIRGFKSNMKCYKMDPSPSECPVSGAEIADLDAGKYKVQYSGTFSTQLTELYAFYTIGIDNVIEPSETPSVTVNPTDVPITSTEPVNTPTVTTAPTKVPDGATTKPSEVPITTAPTKVPGTTPTKEPDGTTKPSQIPAITTEPGGITEPTKVPDVTTEPTKEPTAPTESGKADMTKSGTEVTVGNVIYKSNGSGSVSYDGVKTDKKTVTVPDKVTINGQSYPVTKISSGAFSGSKVQKVTLGKNVKNIGTNAFKNCKKLTKVTFPAKVTTVGAGSFSGCTKLGSVSLPASVKTVGAKAFKNCKKMKKLTLGKAVKTKKGKVMFGATGGTKVSIGASALENCLSLRSVIINSQVTKIGNNTFKNCKKLASMLVKSLKLKTVGNHALKGVSNCKISVPTIRLKKYRTLFTNKGQGKKVVIAKV